MACQDCLSDKQFGKHNATVTKPGTTDRGGTIEVAATRTTPVDLGYRAKHNASSKLKSKP